jgi:hypothetical protein
MWEKETAWDSVLATKLEQSFDIASNIMQLGRRLGEEKDGKFGLVVLQFW